MVESGAKCVGTSEGESERWRGKLTCILQDSRCLRGREQVSPVFLPFHSLVATDVARGSSESVRACMWIDTFACAVIQQQWQQTTETLLDALFVHFVSLEENIYVRQSAFPLPLSKPKRKVKKLSDFLCHSNGHFFFLEVFFDISSATKRPKNSKVT